MTSPQEKAKLALRPSVNGAVVISAFQKHLLGDDADVGVMIERLLETTAQVNAGDLRSLEAMLVSQATALQTIFASLARRAQQQEYQRHLEAFLGLALKAQAQSRATISALVDLKYPRQATFVKQANIAHGAQQVNNGGAPTSAREGACAEEKQHEQNKLLEADHGQPGGWMDTGAATTGARGDPTMDAVAPVDRT